MLHACWLAWALAFTTDSYVVRPWFSLAATFGRLAVIGTVNDLAMVGACPLALSLSSDPGGRPGDAMLRHIARLHPHSGCGVRRSGGTGDTRWWSGGKGGCIFHTTSAVGRLRGRVPPSPTCGSARTDPGEWRSGTRVRSWRHARSVGFRTDLQSDLASLLCRRAGAAGGRAAVHAADLTRGGSASSAH